MEKEQAADIIQEYINTSKIDDIEILGALQMSVVALRIMGCGCDLCLSHNNMRCPKYFK